MAQDKDKLFEKNYFIWKGEGEKMFGESRGKDYICFAKEYISMELDELFQRIQNLERV